MRQHGVALLVVVSCQIDGQLFVYHFRSVITIRLGCEVNVFLVDKAFLAHNIHEKLIE